MTGKSHGKRSLCLPRSGVALSRTKQCVPILRRLNFFFCFVIQFELRFEMIQATVKGSVTVFISSFRANLALLHSNTGRLMRLCAQAVRTDKPLQGEFSSEEKTFYKQVGISTNHHHPPPRRLSDYYLDVITQAIEFYNRALQSLAERKACPEVWDAVTWELSGAYFTMATLLQDYPPLSILSQQEVWAIHC